MSDMFPSGTRVRVRIQGTGMSARRLIITQRVPKAKVRSHINNDYWACNVDSANL